MPLKFKILNSDADINTKAIAIRDIDKLSEMCIIRNILKWILD